MNIDKIKELVALFHQVYYKDLFGALMLNEKIEYLHDLEDVGKSEIDYLEKLYDFYMDSDELRLINNEEIIEAYEIVEGGE